MLRTLVFLLLIAPLGAVEGKKIYNEGDDPLVADCADQCNVVKMRCRGQARDQYQYCKNANRQMEREYNRCRNSGGRFCTKPQRCPIMQTAHCSNSYDACFLSCGGTIEDTRKKKGKKKPPAPDKGSAASR